MKRLACIILAFLVLFTFAGCGGGNDVTEPDSTEAPTAPKTLFFGNYEQDGDKSVAEPIEWIVLAEEDGKMLVISKYALDCQMFNTIYDQCAWDTCSLRVWLNDTFYSAAFSEHEKARIVLTEVTPDANLETSDNDNGLAVQDHVFLLSSVQAASYFKDDASRKCQATVYAQNAGVMTDADGNCSWWLRTMGHGFRAACYVSDDGALMNDGRGVDYVLNGVRPAMWITAE